MVKRAVLPVLLLAFFCSTVFASMTIFFKDGTKREVHKITFRGDHAELYLVTGDTVTVPHEKIDLPTSGIGVPVGTYGQTKVTGQRETLPGRRTQLGDPMRQQRLAEDWERAEKSAIAISSVGPIQAGDTVKIVGETTPRSKPQPQDYYDYSEYKYDPECNCYRFTVKYADHAYVVVYKNGDGTFGKRLFDAATFASHFKINQPDKSSKPFPIYSDVPEKQPEQTESKAPPETEPAPIEVAPSQPETTLEEKPAQSVETTSTAPAPAPNEATESRKPWTAFLVFVLVVVALGIVAWFFIGRSHKPLIDTSKFHRYEEDLREFEIAIWLKNGKTTEQLMEICLKKFYQDNPIVLSSCGKILKNTPKSGIVPAISKQTGRSLAEAEAIYDQLHYQIDRIRNLIQEVSHRTGITPARSVVAEPPATARPHVVEPVRAQSATPTGATLPANLPPPKQSVPPTIQELSQVPPGHSTSSVSVNVMPGEKPSATLIEPDAPMRNSPEIPPYANSVLNQISFLSSSED